MLLFVNRMAARFRVQFVVVDYCTAFAYRDYFSGHCTRSI